MMGYTVKKLLTSILFCLEIRSVKKYSKIEKPFVFTKKLAFTKGKIDIGCLPFIQMESRYSIQHL